MDSSNATSLARATFSIKSIEKSNLRVASYILVFMLDEREVHLYVIISSLKGWRRRSSAYVGVALAPPSILSVDDAKPFTLSGEL